jgi:hypothetical protein
MCTAIYDAGIMPRFEVALLVSSGLIYWLFVIRDGAIFRFLGNFGHRFSIVGIGLEPKTWLLGSI